MVPATAVSVAIFLLLVAPGIFFELLRQRTQHPKSESAFVEISRVLLGGTLLTAFTLFLLSLIRLVVPPALVDVSQLLLGGTAYIAHHITLTGWSLVVELGISLLLAIALNDLLTPSHDQRIHQFHAWRAVTEYGALPGEEIRVSVRLTDGTEIIGCYDGSSTELEPAKRELILAPPISFRLKDTRDTVPLDHSWQRIVLSGAQIAYLAATRVAAPSKTQPTRRQLETARRWLGDNWLGWKLAVPALAATLLIVILVGLMRDPALLHALVLSAIVIAVS